MNKKNKWSCLRNTNINIPSQPLDLMLASEETTEVSQQFCYILIITNYILII